MPAVRQRSSSQVGPEHSSGSLQPPPPYLGHPPWTPLAIPLMGPPPMNGHPVITAAAPGAPMPPNIALPNNSIDFDMLNLMQQVQRVCPLPYRDQLQQALAVIGYSPTIHVVHSPDRAAQIAEAYKVVAHLAIFFLQERERQALQHEEEQRRLSYQAVNVPNIPFAVMPQTDHPVPTGAFGVLNMRGNYPANHYPAAPHQRAMAPPIELPTFSFLPVHPPEHHHHHHQMPMPIPVHYAAMQLPTPVPTPQEGLSQPPERSPSSSDPSTPRKIKITWKAKAKAEAAANGAPARSSQPGQKRKRKSTGTSKDSTPKRAAKSAKRGGSLPGLAAQLEDAASATGSLPGSSKRNEGKDASPGGWVPYSVNEFLKKN